MSTMSVAPPPPRTPHPFLWRCCVCRTVYRLATTRRCLHCAHRFCLGMTTEPATPPRPRSNSSSSGGRVGWPRRRRAPAGRGNCSAEFDYEGWAAWTAWRAAVSGQRRRSTESIRTGGGGGGGGGDGSVEQRRRRILQGGYNCWDDCAFPSECRHVRFREVMEQRRRRAEAKAAIEEEERRREKAIEEEERKNKAAATAAQRVWPEEEEEEEGEGEEMDTQTWELQFPTPTPTPSPPPPAAGRSPAVDATKLSRAAIAAFLAEDEAMVPPDLLRRTLSPSSSISCSYCPSLVMVDAEEEEEEDRASDAEDEDLYSDSSCSSSSDDNEEEEDEVEDDEAVQKAWEQFKKARRALMCGRT